MQCFGTFFVFFAFFGYYCDEASSISEEEDTYTHEDLEHCFSFSFLFFGYYSDEEVAHYMRRALVVFFFFSCFSVYIR